MANGLPEIRLNAITTPPSSVSDGGARAFATTMGDLARGAAAIAGVVRANEEKEGSESALKAFNDAAATTPAGEVVSVPERPGGLLDRLGVADEAYENTLKALSIQRAEKDANETLRQLRVDTFGKPSEFEKLSEEWISGYLGDAPPETVEQIELVLRDRANSLHSDALIERRKLDMQEDRQGLNAQIANREETIRDLADRYGMGAFEREDVKRAIADMGLLLDRKADDPTHVYSEEQRDLDYAQFLDGLKVTAASATLQDEVRDALDYQGVDGAKSTLSEFLNSDVVQAFDRKTQGTLEIAGERLIAEREQEIKKAEAEAKKNRSEIQSAQYNELLVRIIDGVDAPTRQELQQAYEKGMLNPGHYGSLVQQLASKSKKRDKVAEAYGIVSGGVPLNPADSEQRKAVDLVFQDQGGKGVMQEDFAAGVDLAMAFATSKGVLPETATSSIKAMINGGSTEQAGAAYDAIARAYEYAPNATNAAFKDSELKEAIYYREMVANGAPPELTVGSIMEQRKAKFDPVLKERLKEGRDLADDEISVEGTAKVIGAGDGEGEFDLIGTLAAPPGLDVLKVLGSRGKPTVAGGADVLAAASARHRDLFAAYYQEHGNADVARKQADAVLKKSFGVSRATGEARVMQYPPEKYYSVPGVNNKWMKKQFNETVADLGDGSYELTSDIQTAAEAQAGQIPTYKVIRTRKDGIIEAVEGRFYFDPADALKEVEQNTADELESARLTRAALVDNPDREKDISLKSVR